MKDSRIGVAIGIISVVFSTLCFLVMPVFTGSVVLSIFFGVPSGIIALSLKAKRTAIVAFVFAPVPALGLLLLEQDLLGGGYMAFLSPCVAAVIAALALIHYARARRAMQRSGS